MPNRDFNSEEFTVKQMVYEGEDSNEHLKTATATEWNNMEGLDVIIERKNLPAILISLSHQDVNLFRRIFVDMGF